MQASIHTSPIGGCTGWHGRSRAAYKRIPARAQASYVVEPSEASTSGQQQLPAPTPMPQAPGFLVGERGPLSPWVRPPAQVLTPPSVRNSGTLRPAPEWFPAWMRYRRREENDTFWMDKFQRNSTAIPDVEKRWTVFSTVWFLFTAWKHTGTPPALRYVWYLAWRQLQQHAYQAHKAFVLWQCRVDAGLAARATGGDVQTFSVAMALRRLHWRNNLVGELLYLVNVVKTGRVHMLPPTRGPPQRPTLYWLF